MLDLSKSRVKIVSIGPEDRALLRSNPSAGAEAGRWTGGGARLTPRSSRPSFGPKAINLLPERKNGGEYKNAKNNRPVCHMSLFLVRAGEFLKCQRAKLFILVQK